MKKTILIGIFLVIALLILTGCESKEEREAREQAIAKSTAEVQARAEKEKQELQVFIDNATTTCSTEDEEDSYNKTICFSEQLSSREVRITSSTVNELCSKSGDSSMCYFYTAVDRQDTSYCYATEAPLACKIASSRSFCNTYENADECRESRIQLIQSFDPERTREECTEFKGTNVQQACKEFEEDQKEETLTNKTAEESKREGFIFMYLLSRIGGFEEETVWR